MCVGVGDDLGVFGPERSWREMTVGTMAAAIIGVCVGMIACIPPVVLLERALRRDDAANIGVGLGSIIASFLFAGGALLVFDKIAGEFTLAFGLGLVGSFVVVWAIESVRVFVGLGRKA